MFFCKICDLTVAVDNIHPSIPPRFAEYLTDRTETPDILLAPTRAELEVECAAYPNFSADYNEFVLLFKKLTPLLLPHNIFFFHSAILSYEGAGYLFTGKSGTGKSTHAILWQKHLGAEIINGDKPLFALRDDGFYAYGNPWAGKEELHRNTRVKLKAAAFLEQSAENSIRRMTSAEVLARFFNQTVYEKDPELNAMLMTLSDKFIFQIPFYLLKCDISKEAVMTAYNAMKGEL